MSISSAVVCEEPCWVLQQPIRSVKIIGFKGIITSRCLDELNFQSLNRHDYCPWIDLFIVTPNHGLPHSIDPVCNLGCTHEYTIPLKLFDNCSEFPYGYIWCIGFDDQFKVEIVNKLFPQLEPSLQLPRQILVCIGWVMQADSCFQRLVVGTED